jgi:hypothetical protein
VAVELLPVLGHPMGHPAQQMGRQVRDLHPRQDQEPQIVGKEQKVPASGDQPMKRSRGPKCRGADDQARQARSRSPAETRYLSCSPTGCVYPR